MKHFNIRLSFYSCNVKDTLKPWIELKPEFEATKGIELVWLGFQIGISVIK